jgi:hypothetical protein
VVEELAAHLCSDDVFQALVHQLTDPDIDGACPDANAAAVAKEKGNVHFRAQELERAAELYTEALRLLDFTSTQGRTQGAVLYGNRAACLLRWTQQQTL